MYQPRSSRVWTTFAKFAAALALLVTLSGADGCQQKKVVLGKVNLQMVPQEYRDCASRVATKLPRGSVSQKELLLLLARVRSSELKFKACSKDAIAWMDAQVRSFNRYYGL